jgi:hypothetical protein
MNQKPTSLLNTAVENLNAAGEALYKPEEDIISYAVCKYSQNAILNYLKGFLQTKGYETHDHETIQGLYNRCKSIEPKFKQIDLRVIDCKTKEIDEEYCIEVDRVKQCHAVADNLDTVLRSMKIV